MESKNETIWNKIFKLFGRKFIKYNTTVLLLCMPLTFLASRTKHICFVSLSSIDFILMVGNAVYIVIKMFINRKLVWK